MAWEVIFFRDFDPEYEELPAPVQDELLAQLKVLERFGPDAGRPRVDTLNGSRHANMKELQFDAQMAYGGLLSRSIQSGAPLS